MPSLTDLFNPSFLMFLGILVLVVAVLVIFFESKLREQNHKINSMLSLVSSMAEELNGIKYVLKSGGSTPIPTGGNSYMNMNNLDNSNYPSLIHVSDDEEEESEDDDDSDADSSDDSEDEEEEDSDDEKHEVESYDSSFSFHVNGIIQIGDESHDNDIKVLNIGDSLNIQLNYDNENENENENEKNDNDKDLEDDLDDLDDLLSDIDSVTEKKESKTPEKMDINYSDIKSINISDLDLDLEETKNIDVLDFKKLSLNKLRKIVTEKGFVHDSSKLKKTEIFKLLGVE